MSERGAVERREEGDEVLELGAEDVIDHAPIEEEIRELGDREVSQVIVANYLDALRAREARRGLMRELDAEHAAATAAAERDGEGRDAERRRATRVLDQRISLAKGVSELDEIIREHAAEMRRIPELAAAERPDGSFDPDALRAFLRYDAGLEKGIRQQLIGEDGN